MIKGQVVDDGVAPRPYPTLMVPSLHSFKSPQSFLGILASCPTTAIVLIPPPKKSTGKPRTPAV